MARQTRNPVPFNRSTRTDQAVTMSSARAGVVVPVGYVPLFAGDSAAGRVGIDIRLKEMPKPLLNGVFANVQAWFVPKSALPYYSGPDELIHARSGNVIKALGQADRTPPAFFKTLDAANTNAIRASEFMKALGIHLPVGATINTDLVDSFVHVYNFRLAAHSSKLAKKQYAGQHNVNAHKLPPAFWPSSRLSRIVPDYERSLVVGALDLDVQAGQLPISGIGINSASTAQGTNVNVKETGGATVVYAEAWRAFESSQNNIVVEESGTSGFPAIFAEMTGQTIPVSLADIDKARTTQAFAKLRTALAGNDVNAYVNDDSIVAMLMQGIRVPEDQFKRPWLLDSKRVAVGFAERHATDGANLDASVTLGRASAMLSLNVPQQDVGGMIVFTVEVLPERIDERMSDEYVLSTDVDDIPNALRDVQRVEPVDLVPNRRVDAAHTTPAGLYGYEPMNDKWNRDFTRLGGDFYQGTPGAGFTENRSNIWQTEIVDPSYTAHHFLAPSPFPHSVFSDTLGDAFEVVARHAVKVVGLTQIGDVLQEDNNEYDDTAAEAV